MIWFCVYMLGEHERTIPWHLIKINCVEESSSIYCDAWCIRLGKFDEIECLYCRRLYLRLVWEFIDPHSPQLSLFSDSRRYFFTRQWIMSISQNAEWNKQFIFIIISFHKHSDGFPLTNRPLSMCNCLSHTSLNRSISMYSIFHA